MEVILLSKEEYQKILDELKEINIKLAKLALKPVDTFIDNAEFMQMMKISRRTAQSWRDNGIVTFSQIGGQLYYKLSDIEDLLERYRQKHFAPGKGFRVKL